MTTKRLDITGPVSAYCLLTVRRKAKALLPSDELIITCDSPAIATTQIPRIARDEGLIAHLQRVSPVLWEVTLRRGDAHGDHHGPDP